MIRRPILDPEEARRTVLGLSRSRAIRLFDWDERLQGDFQAIERDAFRDELRYSFEDMIERSRCVGFEGLMLFLEDVATAIVFLYDIASSAVDDEAVSHSDRIYLDTIAVRTPGRGIGSKLLEHVLSRCERAGVSAIALDTERSTERGFRLVEFYEKFGFKVVSEDEKSGNITMRCDLPRHDSPGDISGSRRCLK